MSTLLEYSKMTSTDSFARFATKEECLRLIEINESVIKLTNRIIDLKQKCRELEADKEVIYSTILARVGLTQ